MKILVLASNPKGTSPLRLDEEVREIDDGIKRGQFSSSYTLHQKWAVRARDMRRALLDVNPDIVHFCGHGAGEEGLLLESETAGFQLIPALALAGLFELFRKQIKCVILNACYSEIQAEAIAKHIKCVVGMSRAIGDKAAIEFSVGFYDALVAGKDIEVAFKFGCNALQLENIPESLTPILIRKQTKTEESKAKVEESKGYKRGLDGRNSASIWGDFADSLISDGYQQGQARSEGYQQGRRDRAFWGNDAMSQNIETDGNYYAADYAGCKSYWEN